MAVVTRSHDPGDSAAGPRSAALAILTHTQYWYALIILTAFFAVAATHSILTAKATVKKVTTITGPGGKPLPLEKDSDGKTKAVRSWGPRFDNYGRSFFVVGYLAIVSSFAIGTVALALHAFVYDHTQRWMHEGVWWWCGESTIVSFSCRSGRAGVQSFAVSTHSLVRG